MRRRVQDGLERGGHGTAGRGGGDPLDFVFDAAGLGGEAVGQDGGLLAGGDERDLVIGLEQADDRLGLLADLPRSSVVVASGPQVPMAIESSTMMVTSLPDSDPIQPNSWITGRESRQDDQRDKERSQLHIRMYSSILMRLARFWT